MRISVKVDGFRELGLRAMRLDQKMRGRVFGQAVTKTAKTIIVPRAKMLAPVRTGAVKSSIVRATRNRPRQYWWSNIITVKAGVFSSKREARRRGVGSFYFPDETIRYYRWLELPQGWLARTELGTKRVPAQPFLLPALEQTQGEAISRMRVELRNGLERQAKRLGAAKTA